LSARRSLPRWRRDVFDDVAANTIVAPRASRVDLPLSGGGEGRASADGVRQVILFADTFNRYFER
jgi:hypothetical protein